MISGERRSKIPPKVRVIVVTGMKAEAKIARAPGVFVVTSCGDSQSLVAKLDLAIREYDGNAAGEKTVGILSFGIAGGLAPNLLPGARLIARQILGSDGQIYPTNAKWSAYLASALPGSREGDLAGADLPIVSAHEKAGLHRHTGALAVDMESHIAAKIAQDHGLAFAALRVIIDPAEQDLLHAAQVGLKPDGKIDFVAIAKSISRHPSQLPALWRLGRDTKIAFAALFGCRQAAGEGFGFFDLG